VITRHAITRRADNDGVDATVAERDYVLAHVVAQLHRANLEADSRIVFKGGTALRLVHIDGYRYSADLDFTILGASAESVLPAVREILLAAKECAGFPLLELNEQGAVAYVGPLGAAKPRTIKLDLADDEYVESVVAGTIRPGIWDDLPEPAAFNVYPVEEIAAEKLRCIMQRVQCRDLYDIYRLVDDVNVSVREVRPLFERKAEHKGLDPGEFNARFDDRLDRFRTRWDTEMNDHVADPPRLDDVIRVVRRHLRAAEMVG